jgi:hypothetical protein
MFHFQDGPVTPLSAKDEEYLRLWSRQHLAPSLDISRQQDLTSEQYRQPALSRSPSIDFTPAHQPGVQSQQAQHATPLHSSLGQQVQTPLNDQRHQSEEDHWTLNIFEIPLDNNGLLLPHPHLNHSFEPQAQTPLHNPTYQSEEHHPTESPSSMESMRPRDTVHARTQHPMNAESRLDSSSSMPASPASAAIIAPHPMTAIPTPEVGGLRFDSYASATATVDPLFRDQVNVKPEDDDILEVEQNAKLHVQSLVDALNHDSWMEAEEFRIAVTGVKKEFTTSEKQAWEEWQEDTFEVVEGHFEMPNIEVRIEWIAWAIFEEILKVHRKGFRYTTLTANRKEKCSQRVLLAVQAIKATAMTRQRILEGCDLSDLAAGPLAYARTTATSFRNNSGRKIKAQANGGGLQPTKKRSAAAMGAVAERYMSRAEIRRVKREDKDEEAQKAQEAQEQGAGTLMEGMQQAQRPAAPPTSMSSYLDTWTPPSQQAQRPAAPPTSMPSYMDAWTPLSQPTQSGTQRMSNITNTGTDHNDVFDDNWNPAVQSTPPNYGIRDGAQQYEDYAFSAVPHPSTDRTGYYGGSSTSAMRSTLPGGASYGVNRVNPGEITFQSPMPDFSIAYQQAPPNTHHQLRRRRTGEIGSSAAVTNARPTDSFQAPSGMPGENSDQTGAKRRRTD